LAILLRKLSKFLCLFLVGFWLCVEVNADKIQSYVEAIVSTIVANTTTKAFPTDSNSSTVGNNLGIPLTGSIAAGFILGITRRG
jgi:hypothetical protein